ncbi:MAG: type II toxin-antitoxin system VapC family toxin [Terracidiphilus sp.]
MPPLLLDTSIYITALRLGSDGVAGLRRIAEGAPLWLSSVVLEELYAGVGARQRHIIERLERDFQRAGRILVPNLTDWTQCGKALALIAAKYDYEQIGKGRLTNDALIAMSAGRLGVTVITANARDFKKLAEFRPFQWRLESLKFN